MVVCSQHRQNHARGWQNNSVCTSTASTATRGTFVNVCTSEHQPSADLMGSEAGGGSTATVDPTQQSRCPINAAEYVCHGYTAGALLRLCVVASGRGPKTGTQDVWITRTNHGASCVTPAALRHNSAGGLRVLNGVTHSGWWGRGNVDSVRLRVHSSVGCTRPLFLAAWFCKTHAGRCLPDGFKATLLVLLSAAVTWGRAGGFVI